MFNFSIPPAMFPFNSVRADCFRILGFDGFVRHSLDDSSNRLAFLLPESYYESKTYEPLVIFLKELLAKYNWRCDSSEVLKFSDYYTNHYRSRCYTHCLGPHILLDVEYDESIESTFTQPLKPPVLENWTIVEISQDAVKDPDDWTAYYTFFYEAAYPADVDSTRDRIIRYVKERIGLDYQE